MTALVPSVALALPLYGGSDDLRLVLDDLRAQTLRDFAVVVTDDRPEHRVLPSGLDGRLTYHANPARLGLIGNWNRSLDLARRLHPEAEYFAWISDHDRRNPRWLERLSDALGRRPDASLAFPLGRSLADGCTVDLPPTGSFPPLRRAEDAIRMASAIRAGDAIYGLFRVSALDRVGPFPTQLLPDRAFLARAARTGWLIEVDERLWTRKLTEPYSVARQRRTLFGAAVPLRAWFPWWIAHGLEVARPLEGDEPAWAAAVGAAWSAVNGYAETRRGVRRWRAWLAPR